MKRRKGCARGHVFYKSSDCPTCPACEGVNRPTGGFMAELAAPARRALEGAGLTTLTSLAKKREVKSLPCTAWGPMRSVSCAPR